MPYLSTEKSGAMVSLVKNTLEKFIVFFILTFHFTAGVCQTDTSKVKARFLESEYIEKADSIVTIRLNCNNEFLLLRQQGNNFLYDLRPNISLSNKLSFSYRFISFGIGFTPKFIPGNNDDDKQGETKAFTFGFSIDANHLVQDLQIGRVKGFYLYNSGDFIPGWDKNKDPYVQIPDLVVAEIYGSTSYKFNSNFSLKAISSQSEIQLKSCGSFIPSLSYSYAEFDNKTTSATQQTSQFSSNYGALVTAGYYYTKVLNSKFYLSAGISPGIGFNHTNLITRYTDQHVYSAYSNLVLHSQERIGLGYNSRKLFAGTELSMTQIHQNIPQSSVQVQATRVFFQVFVGYRFTAPHFLREKTDQVKDLVPQDFRKLLE